MKKLLLFSFFAFYLTLFCGAQNLVPNPSFEDMIACPDNTGQVDSCVGWSIAYGTPDFYSTCAPYPVCIPDNLCGSQMPFEGNSYMGIITYQWWAFWREIIGTQLFDTLIPGNRYYVSMRVSRGNWTNMSYNCSASNKLGIRFSTYPYSISSPASINNYAQVYTDSIITDTLNWVLLSWDYVADSAYKYLYIGNFFDDANTDTTVINAPLGQFGIAYYFIDSVNVHCVDVNCITSVNEPDEEYSMLFNSGLKTLEIVSDVNQNALLNIFNCNGQLVESIETSKQNIINMANLKSGIYIAQLKTTNQSFTKKIFIY